MVKDIPNAKIQIMDLLKIICNHQITQNKQILDEDNSFEISRVLENYISNPKAQEAEVHDASRIKCGRNGNTGRIGAI